MLGPTLTSSPSFVPSRAFAIGFVKGNLPVFGSASSGFTNWKLCSVSLARFLTSKLVPIPAISVVFPVSSLSFSSSETAASIVPRRAYLIFASRS